MGFPSLFSRKQEWDGRPCISFIQPFVHLMHVYGEPTLWLGLRIRQTLATWNRVSNAVTMGASVSWKAEASLRKLFEKMKGHCFLTSLPLYSGEPANSPHSHTHNPALVNKINEKESLWVSIGTNSYLCLEYPSTQNDSKISIHLQLKSRNSLSSTSVPTCLLGFCCKLSRVH